MEEQRADLGPALVGVDPLGLRLHIQPRPQNKEDERN